MKRLLLSHFFVVALGTILSGCSHTPAQATPAANSPANPGKPEATAVAPPPPDASSVTAVGTYPREKKEWSEKLNGYLKDMGVKEVKRDDSAFLTAYDVTCTMTPVESNSAAEMAKASKCEFYDTPAGTPKRKKIEVNGTKMKSAADLRSFLQGFPVDQGDSGATARFVQCEKHRYGTDCYLAIKVNYEGP